MNFAKELALFSAIAEKKGMVNSLEGNLSVIDRSTGNIYITPSHKAKALLEPEDVCVVSPEGEQVGGRGIAPGPEGDANTGYVPPPV